MTQPIEPVPTTTGEIEDHIFKACRRFVTDDAAEAVLELLEAAKQEGRREGLEEARNVIDIAGYSVESAMALIRALIERKP